MIRSLRVPVLLLVVLTLVSATVLAAWNLKTAEVTSYTGAIGTVRTGIATYTSKTGANAGTVGAATVTLLKSADRRLAKALSRMSSPTTWNTMSRSLSALQDAAYYLRQAGRLEGKKNTAFKTFVNTSGAGLFTESNKLVVSATTYVTATFTSKRATRKILRAGGKNTKAKAKANATRPKYDRAIGLNNKAIQILGKAGLL